MRLTSVGAIAPGKNLEIGDYILQIITTDKTDTKKFATQFVEFEIIEYFFF